MKTASAIYEGSVVHERLRPKRHRLKYQVFSLLLDLDELTTLDKKFQLFGYNRWSPISFYDKDHGETNNTQLRPWAEARMREAEIESDGGAIRVLCTPRIFGYAFNPITTFFCYRKDGQLAAILYEVCNTFKERHTYTIPVIKASRPVIRQSCQKRMYVSPFIEMDMTYHFRIIPPAAKVNIVIREEDKDGLVLAASHTGSRSTLTNRALMSCLLRFPLLTLKVIVGIHWEACKLVAKGFPVFTHKAAKAPVQSSVGVHDPMSS